MMERSLHAHLDAAVVGLVRLVEIAEGVVEVLLVLVGLFGDAFLDLADLGVLRVIVGLSEERHGESYAGREPSI